MTSTKTGKSMTMAELLALHKTSFVNVSKGQVLQGVITKLNSSEILVDIGAKTEALVLEKDKNILRSLLSSLKLGDKVTVSVLNPESDYGNPVVSLRRFNDDRHWIKLEALQKDKQQIEVTVDEVTKGGFIASTKDGVSGFLPNSQTVFLENPQGLLGKTIKVLVIELNRPARKIILSQKATVGSEDFEKSVKGLKVGQKIQAKISNVAPFGIFVLIELPEKDTVEGFVHISEISWDRIATIPDTYKAGETLEAQIINLDKESKRINLSIKLLTANPFEAKLKAYAVDQKVSGSVTKILSIGVLVKVGEGIEGFIKKDKIPPTITYNEGSPVNATVVEVDLRKHRLVLVPVLTEKPLMYR